MDLITVALAGPVGPEDMADPKGTVDPVVPHRRHRTIRRTGLIAVIGPGAWAV